MGLLTAAAAVCPLAQHPELWGWQAAHSALKANSKHAACSAAPAALLFLTALLFWGPAEATALHDPPTSNTMLQQHL